MKTIILYFILTIHCIAQTPDDKIDSLKNLLTQTSLSHQKEIKILTDLSWAYLYTDSTQSQQYLESMLAKAYDSENAELILKAEEHKGKWYFDIGNLQKSEVQFKQLASIALQYKNQTYEAYAYQHLGNIYKRQGKIEAAKEQLLHSVHLLQKQASTGYAQSLNVLGRIYAALHNYDSARICLLESIAIYEKNEYPKGVAGTYMNLGVMYARRDSLKTAAELFQKAAQVYEKHQFHKEKYTTFINIALAHQTLGTYDSAATYYLATLAYFEQTQNLRNLGFTHSNLAGLYQLQESRQQAIKHYKLAGKYLLKLQDSVAYVKNTVNLARNYFISQQIQMVDSLLQQVAPILESHPKIQQEKAEFFTLKGEVACHNNNTEQAKQHFEKAYQTYHTIASELGKINTVIALAECQTSQQLSLNAHQLEAAFTKAQELKLANPSQTIAQFLTQYYEQTGDFKKAYQYHKQSTHIKDTLFNKEKEKIIQQLSVQYETDKKEKENQILKLERAKEEHDKWVMGGVGFSLSITLGILMILVINTHKHKLKEKNHVLQEEKRQKEISELKLQNTQLEINKQQNEIKALIHAKMQANFLIQDLQFKLSTQSIVNKQQLQDFVKSKQITNEEVWQEFQLLFEKVHPNFFSKIKQHCTKVTNTELKYCAAMRLNLSNGEIAYLTTAGDIKNYDDIEKAKRRVKQAKYRLKQKGLTEDFIMVA